MKSKSFIMCLEVKEGSTVKTVFEQMKELQSVSEYADNTVVIKYTDDFELMAGFYDDFDDFYDLFDAIMYRDIVRIKNHVATFFPKLNSNEAKMAIKYICRSLNNYSIKLSNEEVAELYNLSRGRSRI